MTDLIAEKNALRQKALEIRKTLGLSSFDVRNLLQEKLFKDVDVVAGYWPLTGELDVRPILKGLHEQGKTCALPVVIAKATPMIFRQWQPDDPLEGGFHGTRHPYDSAPALEPDLILTPLVAFDRTGGRLGFGGGYYDRTIQRIRKNRDVIVAGIAFNEQEMMQIPMEETDQRLDWIVTPTRVIECVNV